MATLSPTSSIPSPPPRASPTEEQTQSKVKNVVDEGETCASTETQHNDPKEEADTGAVMLLCENTGQRLIRSYRGSNSEMCKEDRGQEHSSVSKEDRSLGIELSSHNDFSIHDLESHLSSPDAKETRNETPNRRILPPSPLMSRPRHISSGVTHFVETNEKCDELPEELPSTSSFHADEVGTFACLPDLPVPPSRKLQRSCSTTRRHTRKRDDSPNPENLGDVCFAMSSSFFLDNKEEAAGRHTSNQSTEIVFPSAAPHSPCITPMKSCPIQHCSVKRSVQTNRPVVLARGDVSFQDVVFLRTKANELEEKLRIAKGQAQKVRDQSRRESDER